MEQHTGGGEMTKADLIGQWIDYMRRANGALTTLEIEKILDPHDQIHSKDWAAGLIEAEGLLRERMQPMPVFTPEVQG